MTLSHYLLTNFKNLNDANYFCIGDFTQYSKHVPVIFQIRAYARSKKTTDDFPKKRLKWNNENVGNYKHLLFSKITNMEDIVNSTDSNECNTDDVVDRFTIL